MKVCAVIPAYNEEKTIAGVVQEAKKYCHHVVVVDDGSEDRTSEIARESGAEVLRHAANIGVGFATTTGNNYAVKKGFDIIVNLDSDGQHSGKSIPVGLELLQEKKLDIVLGSRFLKGTERMPLILKAGNKFLTYVNKFFFGSEITDTQSGFRILTRNTWNRLSPEASGYAICSEIAAKIGMQRLKYAEIPIDTIYLDKFKGTTILDGFKIFSQMVWWWLRRWFSGSK
jgi:glycosyltransferase involved in cell wall biosynthesis